MTGSIDGSRKDALLAGRRGGRRRIDRGRNLRRHHERKNDGRYAYQSQELINGKHRYRPPKMTRFREARSVRPLSGHLIACEKLIGIDRSRNGEQRQHRNDRYSFHATKGRFGLRPKTSAFGAFSGRTRETIVAAPGDRKS